MSLPVSATSIGPSPHGGGHQQRRDILAREPAIDLDAALAEMPGARRPSPAGSRFRRVGIDAERAQRRRPAARSAACACASSPSTTTVPSTSATAAVRKRVAVPALPSIQRLGRAPQRARAGHDEAGLVRLVDANAHRPQRRRPSAPCPCSSARRSAGSCPWQGAASSSARLVIDLLPGGTTRPTSGRPGGTMVSGGEDMGRLEMTRGSKSARPGVGPALLPVRQEAFAPSRDEGRQKPHSQSAFSP